MATTLVNLIGSTAEEPAAVKQRLRDYAERNPEQFQHEAIPVLAGEIEFPAVKRYIAHLLLQSGDLIASIIDPARTSLKDAVTLARATAEAGIAVDGPLYEALGKYSHMADGSVIVIRILDLLRDLSLGSQLTQFQADLMAHTDARVKSKAALVIAKTGKNPAWAGRRLNERDARVQANAVEAIWDIDDQNARAILTMAAQSPHNRVAANALIGQYRLGDLDSVKKLLDMASGSDPLFRSSALWAMGETEDVRFLPFLTSVFSTGEGKEKQRALHAMARIQRRLRSWSANGELEVTARGCRVLGDGSRAIVIAVSSPTAQDLPTLTPAQVACWEHGKLVTDYSLTCLSHPTVLLAGFGIPLAEAQGDAYLTAAVQAVETIGRSKRPGDLWTVQRYLADGEHVKPSEDAPPRDPAIDAEMKNNRGLLADTEITLRALRNGSSRDRAKNLPGAVASLFEETGRGSGARHVFVFAPMEAAGDLTAAWASAAAALKRTKAALHGFALPGAPEKDAFEKLCLSTEGGSFDEVPVEGLAQAVRNAYRAALNSYQVVYRPRAAEKTKPETEQDGKLEMRISTPLGCGRIVVDLPTS